MSGPSVIFQTGDHASRPSNGSGCVLYSCTDHDLVYRDDGTSWTTFMDLVPGGAGIAETLLDAKGDIIAATAADTAARVAVGTNGHLLAARSGATPGIAWEAQTSVVAVVFDGGGVEIADNVQLWVPIPFAWSDIAWARALADTSGAIVVDVWKDTYANYPPTDSPDSITASAPITITASGTKSEDATLTGWTKTGSAGDILKFNVDSCTTITKCTIALALVRG